MFKTDPLHLSVISTLFVGNNCASKQRSQVTIEFLLNQNGNLNITGGQTPKNKQTPSRMRLLHLKLKAGSFSYKHLFTPRS